jgi:AraC-like DNA-binding protein
MLDVVRHESALGRWQFATARAGRELRGLVWSYTDFLERTAPLDRREVPEREVTLILNLGPDYELRDPEEPAGSGARRGSFVAGLWDRPVMVGHRGEAQGVEVRLTPLGARKLLGVPMSELTNEVVELEDLMGAWAGELTERLAGAGGPAERLVLLDAELTRRAAEQGYRPAPEVAWAWGRLQSSHGAVPIGDLAEQIGWSHRRFIDRFRDQVGLTPKTFARVLRFSRVVDVLRRADEVRWAELAYDCGYYDQSHFNRDFRQFAGMTPTQFLTRRLPDGAGLEG